MDNDDRPRIVDMERIVELLGRTDVPAEVEMTGGGCATIFYGPPALLESYDNGDGTATDYYGLAYCAGPGWFEGPSYTLARGHLDEFYWGPNDQGESGIGEDALDLPDFTTDLEIVKRMVALMVRHPVEPRFPPADAEKFGGYSWGHVRPA